jgi:MFS family permease
MDISRRFARLRSGGPLAVREFRLLLAGQLTSSIGDLCYAVALPWLVLSGRGGPVLLGWVLACYGIARAAAIPVGGVLSDKFGSRRLMLTVDMVRCVVVGTLGVLALSGLPPLAVLAPIAAVFGAGSGLFMPASYALIPEVLPEGQLTEGNSLSSAIGQAGSLFGPVAGGLLVANAGPGTAFLIDAFTFAVSAATLWGMRSRRPAAAPGGSAAAQAETPPATTGAPTFVVLLRNGRLLHIIMVTAFVGNLVYAGTSEIALPTLAHARFGAAGYSALLIGLGAGLVAGAALAHRSREASRPVIPLGALGLVMAGSIALLPFSGGLPGAIACITAFSVANSWSGVVVITMLQVWTPRALLGRTMSVLMLAMTGTFPLAVAVTGLLVNRVGVNVFFLVAGAAMSAAVLTALTRPAIRDYRAGDRFTLAARQGPAEDAPCSGLLESKG